MRRRPLHAAWLALLLALAIAPVAVADERDPRCEGWERSGPPPGIDLAIACPQAAVPTTANVDLGHEPLVPYIVGLLVMAGVLMVVGVVAMRVTAKPARDRRALVAAWWTCAACGSPNQPDRPACIACQASRAGAARSHPV